MQVFSKSRYRRALATLTLSAAALVGSLATPLPSHAQTQTLPTLGLPDFTGIVAEVDSAVVNIRTTATVPVRAGGGGRGNDPYELFRWFFGPDFAPPGSAPGPRGQPQPQQPQERTVPRGVGSGFFISKDGFILTNNHVVAGATDIYVTLTDGREFEAKVIGSDERTDVALIKIDTDEDMAALTVGDAKALKKGQWVLAIGSPFGLESTVTAGIVSAIGRDTGEYLPFIQTDVAVNPGNSGGPLLTLDGKVVGINSQIISRSGGFMGISLAIPIDEAMRVVAQLKESGRVTRGRIGVSIGDVSKDVAAAIGLPRAEGALVSGVEPDAPADAAGVQAGDVILSFNGQPITRRSDLPRLVGETRPGTTAKMDVWRKGKRLTLAVTVAPMQDAAAGAPTDAPAAGTENALGLTVEPVPADQLQRLRIRGGVRVTQAEGPGERAGIQAGDIILALNNNDITTPRQFATLAKRLDKSRVAGLLIRRGDATLWVAVRPGN